MLFFSESTKMSPDNLETEEHTTAPESEQGDEGSGEKGSGGEAKE